MSLTTLLAAAVAASGMSGSADTLYTTNGHWNSDSATMRASATSFPSGSSYRNALAPTVGYFNKNPSQFRLNISYNDGSVSRANFQNEIWFTNNWKWDDAPAMEFTRYGLSGRILASDIIFNNSGATWTTSEYATSLIPYGGTGRSFQGVLLHELGHTAGLGHEDDEYNIMGSDWSHVHRWRNRVRPYFGEDASDGLVGIYGRRSGQSIEDLSVTHMQYTGANDGYSTHGRTKMTDANGNELNWNSYSGMRRYRVNRGMTVKVEFTYENNGETTKSNIPVGFYISTNNLITTGDQLIATRTFNLSRDNVATRYDTVTIPNNLTPGQTYYLGVVVDRTNNFAEVDEDNNRAFQIIKVIN